MGVLSLAAYKPVPSTLGDANQISNGMTAIETAVNAIDNTQFAAGKIFDPAKIMQSGATSGQALIWNGSNWAPANLASTTYRKTTAKVVNTTTSPTDLLNGEITIGAGVLGTTGVARLTAFGDFLQNSGGATNAYRYQLLLGTTTLFDTGAPGAGTLIANSATRGRWKIVATIINFGAANAQIADFELQFTPGSATQLAAVVAAAFTTGQGIYHNQGRSDGTIPELHAGAYNASAEDTSSSKALVLKIINPSASASCETVLKGALVEIV